MFFFFFGYFLHRQSIDTKVTTFPSTGQETPQWQREYHEGLLLRQEPVASHHHRSLQNRDVTIVNNCGTQISHFKAFYNVDSQSSSFDTTRANLLDGESITITVGPDDTWVRYYAIQVTYEPEMRVVQVSTQSTTRSPMWANGVDFRIRRGQAGTRRPNENGGQVLNFPIYVTNVMGKSEYRLCGDDGGDPINVPVGVVSTTSSTTAAATTTTTTPEQTPGVAALASCADADDVAWCEAWLTAHNARREAFHASRGATTPSFLTWDTSLAAQARAWAETFSPGDGCDLAHDPDAVHGENLALNAGTPGSVYGEARSPHRVLEAWWDDEYPLTQPPYNTLQGALHFTQAAWYKSTLLGCGMISKDSVVTTSGGQTFEATCHIQVCRYGPGAGNCNLSFDTWESDVMTGRTC